MFTATTNLCRKIDKTTEMQTNQTANDYKDYRQTNKDSLFQFAIASCCCFW